jgi:hypothetical protein
MTGHVQELKDIYAIIHSAQQRDRPSRSVKNTIRHGAIMVVVKWVALWFTCQMLHHQQMCFGDVFRIPSILCLLSHTHFLSAVWRGLGQACPAMSVTLTLPVAAPACPRGSLVKNTEVTPQTQRTHTEENLGYLSLFYLFS